MLEDKPLWSKDYILVLLAILFASLANGALIVILPVYIIQLGGNNALTGLMMAGMTLAGMMAKLIAGPLIDRVGRKKILVLGSSTFAINAILYCFVMTIPGLFVLRILNGITQGIYFPVPPTIVADLAPKGRLVEGLGYFGIPPALGTGIGPVAGMWVYERFGVGALFATLAVLSVISFVITLFVKEKYKRDEPQSAPIPEDIGPQKRRLKLSTIVELSVILPAMVILFISLGNSAIMNFLLPFGIERGIANISVFFLINNIVVVITRLGTPRLTRKFGILRLITVGGVCIVSSTLLIAFSHHIAMVIAASVLFGVGVSTTIQLLQVITLGMVPENKRGVANTTWMLLFDIGVGLGATVWGASTVYGGYTITYALSALTVLLSVVLHVTLLIPKHKKNMLTESSL